MRLAHGLVVQWEVVTSLVVRETRTRFGDSKFGYAWALVQPMTVIAFFVLMFAIGRTRPTNGMDIIGFFATGLLGYDVVTNPIDRASAALAGNQALMVYPQVKPLDLVIARVSLEAITISAVFGIIMIANGLWIGRVHVDDLFEVLEGFLLGTWLGGALGLVFCALNVISTWAERLRGIVMRPLFFVSGVFFTANGLPVMVRDVVRWNPILHVVELVRGGWYGTYESTVASPRYLLIWCVATTAFGLLLEQSVRRRVGN